MCIWVFEKEYGRKRCPRRLFLDRFFCGGRLSTGWRRDARFVHRISELTGVFECMFSTPIFPTKQRRGGVCCFGRVQLSDSVQSSRQHRISVYVVSRGRAESFAHSARLLHKRAGRGLDGAAVASKSLGATWGAMSQIIVGPHVFLFPCLAPSRVPLPFSTFFQLATPLLIYPSAPNLHGVVLRTPIAEWLTQWVFGGVPGVSTHQGKADGGPEPSWDIWKEGGGRLPMVSRKNRAMRSWGFGERAGGRELRATGGREL